MAEYVFGEISKFYVQPKILISQQGSTKNIQAIAKRYQFHANVMNNHIKIIESEINFSEGNISWENQ